MKKITILSASILSVLSQSGSAAVLEEVIVTAQKRAQSINDVGLSVSSASGEQLREAGINDTGDLVKVSPGLVFTSSQNGTPLFSLRGVGFNDYTLGASPAVSVYLDEVPLAYGAFTKGIGIDLERVEVLKGPQGLLFGQNSTGGAINYIAAKPGYETEAGITASYGSFERREISGYLSGPMGDSVAARIALSKTNSEEWQKSQSSGRELGAEDLFKMRVQFLWDASERTSFLLGLNGWSDKSDTQAGQLQALKLQTPDPASALLADPVETQRRIDVFKGLSTSDSKARDAEWDIDRQLKRDDSFVQTSLRIEHELNDSLTLTALTSILNYIEDYSMDRDGTTLENAGIDSAGKVSGFSQELRLAGSSPTMQWLLGLNYAANDVISNEKIHTDDSTNTAILPGGPWIKDATTSITQDIRDAAIFGNIEYDLGESLTLLAGARYAENSNDYSACMRSDDPGIRTTFPFISDVLRGQNPGTTVIAPHENPCLSLDGQTFELCGEPYIDSLDEDNISWRLGLNYRLSDDVLLYTLASKGYKTGSFPLLPASTTTQFSSVTQESVQAFEIGAKWGLRDRGLQLNGAIFSYAYEDKQVRGIVKDPVFNQLDRLVNIPESTILGAEAELIYSPVQGLLLRLSGTYVDTEVDEFYTFYNPLTQTNENGINGAREQGDFSGSDLPYTPKIHVVGDIDYRFSLNDQLSGFVGANILYDDEANSTFGNPPEGQIDAFTTVDVRAGLESAEGTWKAFVWGKNVSDEYYWSNQFVTQDVVVRYTAKPATFGLTLEYSFF